MNPSQSLSSSNLLPAHRNTGHWKPDTASFPEANCSLVLKRPLVLVFRYRYFWSEGVPRVRPVVVGWTEKFSRNVMVKPSTILAISLQ